MQTIEMHLLCAHFNRQLASGHRIFRQESDDKRINCINVAFCILYKHYFDADSFEYFVIFNI